MNTGETLFAQVMELIPWSSFSRIVSRYRNDARERSLSAAEHFRVMAEEHRPRHGLQHHRLVHEPFSLGAVSLRPSLR
jgi:hypothetical protein